MVAPDVLTGRDAGVALFIVAGAAMVQFLLVALDVLVALASRRAAPAGGSVLPRRIALALLAGAPLLLAAARWPAAAAWMAVPAVAFAVTTDRLAARRQGGDAPFWWASVGAAGLLVAAFFVLHVAQQTLIAVRPGTERLHAALYAGTWLVSLVLWMPWTHRIEARRAVGRRSWWSGVALVLGVLLVETNRRVLLGLYPAVHAWMVVVGTLALDAALAPWLVLHAGRARRLAGGAALVLLTVGALVFQYAPLETADPVLRAAAMERTLGPPLLGLLPEPPLPPGGATDHPLLAYPQYLDTPWSGARGLNLLLLSLDGARADALLPETAPNFTRLRATCADFTSAYAPGSRTSLSMGALLIGRYSADIEWRPWIRTAAGRMIDPADSAAAERARRAPGTTYTTVPVVPPEGNVPQRLAAAGLETLATPFGGHEEFFRRGVGFEVGFDQFADLSDRGWRAPSSAKVAGAALEQLARAGTRRPFFQWVHFFDSARGGGTARRLRPADRGGRCRPGRAARRARRRRATRPDRALRRRRPRRGVRRARHAAPRDVAVRGAGARPAARLHPGRAPAGADRRGLDD